jgi:hypothetical protein
MRIRWVTEVSRGMFDKLITPLLDADQTSEKRQFQFCSNLWRPVKVGRRSTSTPFPPPHVIHVTWWCRAG